MKKYLKFSGIAAAVVALVGWILIMACPAVKFSASLGSLGTLNSQLEGTTAIFGNGDYKLAAAGLIAWLFTTIAFLALVAAFVLPFFKINVLDKFAGAINLGALALLLASGICAFCIKASWMNANDISNGSNFSIGAGWVIGGILLISAGALAILPAVFAFIDSNKK